MSVTTVCHILCVPSENPAARVAACLRRMPIRQVAGPDP